MADYYSKIGISDGPSLYVLSQALFGVATSTGKIDFPKLKFELSKNYLFGWMPNRIGVEIKSVERVKPDVWNIRGKISDEDEKFRFEVQYSTHDRTGAGKIFYPDYSVTSNPAEYCLSIIDFLESKKKVGPDDAFACALKLFYDEDVIGGRRTLVMSQALKKLNIDHKTKYVVDILIKRLSK